MKVVHKLSVNLGRLEAPLRLSFMQKDSVRQIEVKLYENNVPWNVPDGASVYLAFRKSNGKNIKCVTLADGHPVATYSDNVVTISVPPEMTALPGNMPVVVVFVDGKGSQISTFPIAVTVQQSPGSDSEEAEPITPDQFDQILSSLALERARIDELVAMRGDAQAMEHTYEFDTWVNGSKSYSVGSCVLRSNGCSVDIEVRITSAVLTTETYGDKIVEIPAEFVPIQTLPVVFDGYRVDPEVKLFIDNDSEGKTALYICNDGSSDFTLPPTGDDANTVIRTASYALKDIAIGEVADLRVGYDGTTYETASKAVRGQMGQVIKTIGEFQEGLEKVGEGIGKIKLFRFTGSPGGACSLFNTNYAELKALYDNQEHIALYMLFADIGDKYYHCAGASKLNGVIGLAFQFCFGEKSEWVFVGEDDSVQMGVVGSTGVDLDDTLSESGKAADAKAVGDALDGIKTALDESIDDTSVSDKAWSSRNTVDKLCPSFTESGGAVVCNPVEGYHLSVQTDEGATKISRRGKNLFQYPYAESTTKRLGITFTDNGDGTITANGTATSDTYFTLTNTQFHSADLGTCILSGCPAGGSADTYYISVVTTGNKEIGAGYPFTYNERQYSRYQIWIKKGVTVENLVFKPQIEVGRTITEYEPYVGEEFAPGDEISAREGVNVFWADSGNITVTGRSDPTAINNNLQNRLAAIEAALANNT